METISNDKGDEIFRQNCNGARRTLFSFLMKQRTSHPRHCTHVLNFFFPREFLKTVEAWSVCKTRTETWGQGAVGKVPPERSCRMLSWSALPDHGNFSSALILCEQEVSYSKIFSTKSEFLKNKMWESAYCSYNGTCIYTASSAWTQPRKFPLCFLPSLIKIQEILAIWVWSHLSCISITDTSPSCCSPLASFKLLSPSTAPVVTKVSWQFSWWMPSSLGHQHISKSSRGWAEGKMSAVGRARMAESVYPGGWVWLGSRGRDSPASVLTNNTAWDTCHCLASRCQNGGYFQALPQNPYLRFLSCHHDLSLSFAFYYLLLNLPWLVVMLEVIAASYVMDHHKGFQV